MSCRLHPKDVDFFRQVEAVAIRLAVEMSCKLHTVTPTRRGLTTTVHGYAYFDEDRIEITVRSWEAGKWAKRRDDLYQILTTICHEIAHLKSSCRDRDHGPVWFRNFSECMLAAARLGLLARLEQFYYQ